eukprot:c11609_g1_i2.p2 GENE.c11609_g1_i2~~c11609_g1_i2.p2  ORF type:complete len:116 (-),score=5.57 c11609_g1_i2:302-649(-)
MGCCLRRPSRDTNVASWLVREQPRSISWLLKGQHVDLSDDPDYGMSPLTVAARYNLFGVGRELLAAGCSAVRVDTSGYTAFRMASELGHRGFIRMMDRAAEVGSNKRQQVATNQC